jgi:HEPN domain-containing protein
MDEAKQNEIRSWLQKGLQDLKSADWLLRSPYPLFNSVGFHCQQAAEKFLNAFLTWCDNPFGRTHSLVALMGECLEFDESFQELRNAATTLTPYAVNARYPGDLPELTIEEAKEAFKLSQQVWEVVIGLLPPEIRDNLEKS